MRVDDASSPTEGELKSRCREFNFVCSVRLRRGCLPLQVNLLRQRASVDFDAAKVSEEDLCILA